MKSPIALLLVLLCFPLLASAQSLERKGTLGVRMENLPDGGIRVLEVIPQTTASAMGMQAGDLITEVNGTEVKEVGALVEMVGQWRQGDVLQVMVQRGKKPEKLNGTVVGKPMEKSENGEVIYGSVPYDGGALRSILELPKGVEKPPVILFLPGVGCGSLDFPYSPRAFTKLLVEEWVKAGIAVYRVEKPGMGDSQGTQHCTEMDYPYEVEAFAAALQTLKAFPEIDPQRIFLYGNSLGTITAPLLAAREPVAGIIAWGGISTSWFEYELKIQRKQKVLTGGDYRKIDSTFRRILPFYYDFYIREQDKATLAQSHPEFVENYFQGDLFHGLHHYRFFQTLNQVDLRSAYADANCPVLCLAGEFDLHTVDTDWAFELIDLVNHYRPGQGQALIVPQTTHHYHTVPSLAFYNELRQSGQLTNAYLSDHFNYDVPQLVSAWVHAQTSSESPH